MIIYMFFLAVEFIGFMMLAYGLMMEYEFYLLVQTTLQLPQIPIPLGFYIIIGAGIIFITLPIIMLIRVKSTGCGKRYDVTPKGKGLFDFIYRDGDIREVYGDRIPGLGLFRIFLLGVLFDTGREPKPGSTYNIPGKKIRFALQDINFTPNPKFPGFYTYLTNLGFNNMTEFTDVMNGYNPEQMVKVWNALVNQELKQPEDYIVERAKTMSKKDIEKNNKLWRQEMKPKKEKKHGDTPPKTPFSIINKALKQEDQHGDETEPEDR